MNELRYPALQACARCGHARIGHHGTPRRPHACSECACSAFDGGAACSSCRASIIWTRTTTGSRMPVDPVPVADGNVALVVRGADGAGLTAIVLKSRRDAHLLSGALTAGPRYKSHFATCPNADKHRKGAAA